MLWFRQRSRRRQHCLRVLRYPVEIMEMPETITVAAKRKIAGATMPVRRILPPSRHRQRRLHRSGQRQNSGDDPINAVAESRAGRLRRHQCQRRKARRHRLRHQRRTHAAGVNLADNVSNRSRRLPRFRKPLHKPFRKPFRKPRPLRLSRRNNVRDLINVDGAIQTARPHHHFHRQPPLHRPDHRNRAAKPSAVRRYPLRHQRRRMANAHRLTRRATRIPSQSAKNRKTTKKTAMIRRTKTKATKGKAANPRSSPSNFCRNGYMFSKRCHLEGFAQFRAQW